MSGADCRSRRTWTGSREDAVRRSRRGDHGTVHAEQCRNTGRPVTERYNVLAERPSTHTSIPTSNNALTSRPNRKHGFESRTGFGSGTCSRSYRSGGSLRLPEHGFRIQTCPRLARFWTAWRLEKYSTACYRLRRRSAPVPLLCGSDDTVQPRVLLISGRSEPTTPP